MISNIRKILTFTFVILNCPGFTQQIWSESFLIPEKGIWGSGTGSNILKDLNGITKWTLEYNSLELANADDYAKTVSTSGGRFEVCDINGEITWRSEWIDISQFQNIRIRLNAGETGSGANTETKYIKAFFKTENTEEIIFETNGSNSGNWGSVTAEQNGINAKELQIIVKISNHYSSDKVILDDVIVFTNEKEYPTPVYNDLIINEILFNPLPDGEDFVEIYNPSDKEFSISKLFLASRDKDLQLTQIYNLAGKNYSVLPGEYLVFTKDTSKVFPFYQIKCPDCFQQIAKIPSFNNDEDHVVLLNENMEILDEFHYFENMHNPLLSDVKGVSLERISFTETTNDAKNWTSSSTESGYATPGYENSQVLNTNRNKPEITFTPDAFSPNNDGFNDEYIIDYQLEKPGYIANATIFNSSGRFVTQLLKNEILGTSGKLTWNGKDETGKMQALGVYIITLEIFNSEGNVYRFKDGIVLTDRLE